MHATVNMITAEAVPVDLLLERVVAATSKDWLAPASHKNAILLALWDRPDLMCDRDVPGLSLLAAAVTSAASRGKAEALHDIDIAVQALRFSKGCVARVKAVIEELYADLGAGAPTAALRRMIQIYAEAKAVMV